MNFKLRDGQMKSRMDISIYLTIDLMTDLHKLSGGLDPHRFLENKIYQILEESKDNTKTPHQENPPTKGKIDRVKK